MDLSRLLNQPNFRSDLARVDKALSLSVASKDPLLTEVAQHLIAAGGKRLRPCMTLAAAMTGGASPVGDDVIQSAVSVELVHLGSLYHDDVLDEASTRRTVASVNAQYGNFMAVISGDYLLARSSAIAASLGTEVAALLAETITILCEGQVREAQYGYDTDRSVEGYLESISGKTASLIATSARVGSLTAGLPPSEIEALAQYGYGFGMAFQIRDDILDVVGGDAQLGKPAGNDMFKGVYTLPVIYALQEEGGGELRALLGGSLEPPERDKARDIVSASPGLPRAVETGRSWAAESVAALGNLPDTPMRRCLEQLAQGIFDDL